MSPDRDVDPAREELLAALRDPIRRRLLFVLGDKPGGATIRQLAGRLGEPRRRVRHYVEMMVADGLVFVGDERPRRGTIERAFRSARVPLFLWAADDPPGEFEPTDVKLALLDILRLTFDTVTEAIAAGTFAGRQGWCAARTWREVDTQGWAELAEIHERATEEVVSVVERAARRLAEGGEAPIPAISALFLFEALPWDG
jgi:DNA-binding transcriptional ArsR family regulator